MKRYKIDKTLMKNNKEFIEKLIAFDSSSHCSLIPRILARRNDFPEAYSHLLDRYMLSVKKDSIMLKNEVYDSAYEMNINMVSHNIENGHITVHFTQGGFADFYNINKSTMREIVSQIIDIEK